MSGTRLKDKVAIVTGGGSGIGRATCELFARAGAKVLVADIDAKGAEETASAIREAGGTAQSVAADVSRVKDAERIAARAVELWPRIDILVNNAASFVRKRADEATREDWDQVLGVNVLGTSFCSKAVIPIMQKQKEGSIVNLGSINGVVAFPDFMTYNATKAAIIMMTKCMAMDLAPDNIRVNCVCPGQTHTPALERVLADLGMTMEEAEKKFIDRHMIKRFGKPQEIAPAILFLASDDASFITAATLMVDGGFTG